MQRYRPLHSRTIPNKDHLRGTPVGRKKHSLYIKIGRETGKKGLQKREIRVRIV